jgi:hypothetical protein
MAFSYLSEQMEVNLSTSCVPARITRRQRSFSVGHNLEEIRRKRDVWQIIRYFASGDLPPIKNQGKVRDKSCSREKYFHQHLGHELKELTVG